MATTPATSQQPVIPDGARTLDVLGRERTQRAGVVRPTIDTSLADGRKPEWLKVKASFGDNFKDLKQLMGGLRVSTPSASRRRARTSTSAGRCARPRS